MTGATCSLRWSRTLATRRGCRPRINTAGASSQSYSSSQPGPQVPYSLHINQLWASSTLKVGGNEKQWGSGRSQMLGNGLGPWRSRIIYNLNTQLLNKNHISFSALSSKMNKRLLWHYGMRCKQFSKGASKLTAPMAMRTKFAAQIMNQIWIFSWLGRVSFYAPNIQSANKLARYK